MNRHEWKAAYRAARIGPSGLIRANGLFVLTVTEFDRVLHPAIIRDRSPRARIANELYWARRFCEAARKRWNSSYFHNDARRDAIGARQCVADCRAIRSEMSAFHRLP